jgi:hypothetical protein
MKISLCVCVCVCVFSFFFLQKQDELQDVNRWKRAGNQYRSQLISWHIRELIPSHSNLAPCVFSLSTLIPYAFFILKSCTFYL